MVAPMDNFAPIPFVIKLFQNVLARYETWSFLQPLKNYVREYGLKFSFEYMKAEDLQTNYINIGPVNKVLNMLSSYHGTFERSTISRVQNSIFGCQLLITTSMILR